MTNQSIAQWATTSEAATSIKAQATSDQHAGISLEKGRQDISGASESTWYMVCWLESLRAAKTA